MLLKNKSNADNAKSTCAAFLQMYDSAQREWKLGKTKVCLWEVEEHVEPCSVHRNLSRGNLRT